MLASGDSYAFGSNKCGQLGTGSLKNKPKEDGACCLSGSMAALRSLGSTDVALSPVKCAVSGASSAACGAEFSVWVRARC